MKWDDTGFLLSKNRYNENSIIAEFFTKNHGKVSGIIFGGTSQKNRNYLQIGNQLFLSFNSKFENRIGYFKIEIDKAFSPFYFDEPKKLNCINLAMNLIKLLTAESQINLRIFELINHLYEILNNDYWLKEYIFWELELLSYLGYELDLNKIVKKKIINNKILYVIESNSEKKIVPNFLIEKDIVTDDLFTLLDGLKLVGDFMDKNILKPNNLNLPISRIQFVNSLK